MQEKGLDDDESAIRIFSSYLVQQVGGRDWSAQEVSHVNMGLRTCWGSHEFFPVSLTNVHKLRANLTGDEPDGVRATEEKAFEKHPRSQFKAGLLEASHPTLSHLSSP